MINEDVGWYGDNDSRGLLIGGCNDMYEEVFVIDDDGASTVSKFGHQLLRLPTGEIFLDGEEQECK